MPEEVGTGGVDLLKRLTLPMALAVAAVVAGAWYVTWATSDLGMVLMTLRLAPLSSVLLGLFFLLMVTMMVAMMLPSALPMIVAYRGLTRLEDGRPVRPPDDAKTALFILPYFLVWGAFGLAALLALIALGLMAPMEPMDSMGGFLVFVPAVVLIAAGAYQFTRTKDVCLRHCVSPMSFVLLHWRPGKLGAVRMGLRHSLYCIGCCWLFMLVLFIAGAMSLLWMGALSLAIFAEKVGRWPRLTSQAIGVVLIAFGVVLLAQVFFMG